jgi:PTH1 family peptidyl-tRNA hydrolase
MKLLVGLGNPGPAYAANRHNVGFHALDALLADARFPAPPLAFSKDFKGEYTKSGDRYVALKPHTYMNRSGEAVQRVMQFFKIKPQDVYILHDDLDIPLGMLKISPEKGSKIHNGLTSVNNSIGSNYVRVRIGIENRDPERRIPGEAYVLQDFTTDERTLLAPVFTTIADRIAAELR